MSFVIWIILGLLISGIIVFITANRTRKKLPAIEMPAGEKLPVTLMQKYSRWSLSAIILLCAGAAALVIHHGPQVWWDDDQVRLTVTFVLLTALIIFALFNALLGVLERRDDGSFDERDSMILARSSAGVGGAIMVVVTIWMIALTESFRETHLVPTYYLYLIFWSVVMTNVIAQIAGILLSYRRG